MIWGTWGRGTVLSFVSKVRIPIITRDTHEDRYLSERWAVRDGQRTGVIVVVGASLLFEFVQQLRRFTEGEVDVGVELQRFLIHAVVVQDHDLVGTTTECALERHGDAKLPIVSVRGRLLLKSLNTYD